MTDWEAMYRALLEYGERRHGESFWPGGDERFCRAAAEAGNVADPDLFVAVEHLTELDETLNGRD